MAAPMRLLRVFNKIKVSYTLRSCHVLNRKLFNPSSIVHPKYVHVQIPLWCNRTLSDSDIKKMVDGLTDKFTEARELIEDARESVGTVYFADDLDDAQAAIKETLEEYSNLIGQLSAEQKQTVSAMVGLRMEELKAQQAALEELLHH